MVDPLEPVWGRRIGFGQSPALIVVDFSRAFTEANRPLGSVVDAQIDVTNRLLNQAHHNHVPVFFTVIAYSEPNFEDAGMWLSKVGGQADLRAGNDGVEVDPRLNREETDTVVVKNYASAFFQTDLAEQLHKKSVDTVFIVGCSTSGCVRATAVDAIQLGFRPMVVREGVADRWARAHQQALEDLEAKYADVVTEEEAYAGLI